MKKVMSFIAAATFVLGMAVAPATAVANNATFSVEINKDCDNCSKENCKGCEGKKEEAKKECKSAEGKKACCAHGAKKETKAEAKAEKKAEAAKK